MIGLIKVQNYSIYANDPYPSNFGKLYKGVIVVVDNDGDDSKYCHFSIRTKKVKDTIFKTRTEKLNEIIFVDSEHSITCDFDNDPKNKSKKTLVFEPEVYDELKENIPDFMKEQGCVFDTYIDGNVLVMTFK